ncbi:MAG: acyl carrier protein [Moorea sp. SIO4A1]|nr:acyl carrier protein [Moorena sp. SIO4A1]
METGFFDLGMDSLTSVELRNKLQISLNCSVPSTLAFDYPKLNKLVDYFAQELNLIDVQEEDTELRSLNLHEEKSSNLSDSIPLTEVELEASFLREIEELEKLI